MSVDARIAQPSKPNVAEGSSRPSDVENAWSERHLSGQLEVSVSVGSAESVMFTHQLPLTKLDAVGKMPPEAPSVSITEKGEQRRAAGRLGARHEGVGRLLDGARKQRWTCSAAVHPATFAKLEIR